MDPLLAVTPESRVDGARCTLIHRMMPHRLLLPPLGGRKKRTACPSGKTQERFRLGPSRSQSALHCGGRGLLDRALLPSAPIRRPSHVEQRRRGASRGSTCVPFHHVFAFISTGHVGTRPTAKRLPTACQLERAWLQTAIDTTHNPHHTPEHPVHHSFYPCSSFHNSPRLIHCHPGETMNDAA